MDPSADVAMLKAQLAEARLDLQKKKTLVHQREEVEERLESMRRELKKVKAKLHQMTGAGKEHRQPLESRAEQLENQLAQLRATMTTMDHKLDLLDEDFEERTERLKDRLVAAILQRKPKKEGEFASLRQSLADQLERQARLQEVLEDCREITGYLLKGHETALSTKGRGLLGYVFGANPNSIISQSLKRALDAARECSEQRLPQITLKPDLKEQLTLHLTQIMEQAEKPWTFKGVTNVLSPMARELEVLTEKLEALSEEWNASILEQEEGIERWLESHCGEATPR